MNSGKIKTAATPASAMSVDSIETAHFVGTVVTSCFSGDLVLPGAHVVHVHLYLPAHEPDQESTP
jgi:hypothetical protein